MSSYLGPLGRMIEFKCPSALEVSADPRSSFQTTMGGRVVEQRGPRGRRTWQASLATATPEQVAGLEALMLGAMGSPPWVWVPPSARSVNGLTPTTSILAAGTYQAAAIPGGPFVATDGVLVPATITMVQVNSSFTGEQEGGRFYGAPVVPGQVVTGSYYASGAGRMELVFRDLAHAELLVVPTQFAPDFQRVSATAVAPAGAVQALLRFSAVTGPVRVGAPAITWTDTVQPWGIGRGCLKATADGLAESLQMAALGSPGMNRSAYQFTVREVG